MEFEELLAPVAGEFQIEEALESWRWLVTDSLQPLVVGALGDLFGVTLEGSVYRLDTIGGVYEKAAASIAEWEEKLRLPEVLDAWFAPAFVQQLRETTPLSQGECYSADHPPILGGTYAVENWRAVNWRVYFSDSGRLHEAIKDLPDGTAITKWNYTEL